MNKNSSEYWGNRKDWLIYHQMESADKTADTISLLYRKAYRQIERNMNNVLDKFALKYRMSKEEAVKILNSLDNQEDVDELLRTLRLRSDNESIKELSMMLDAPSYRYRINALKDTMAEVDTVMKLVYENELALSTKHYENTAKESYLKNTFTLQQQIGYGKKVTTLPSSTISKLLKSKWSGENYSKRIWNNTSTLAGDLKTELLTSVLMGRTEHETTKLFLNKCAKSANNARRLIRTESAYIYNQMDVEAYKNGGIEYYRFVATLDLKTSTICSELDGKVFKLTDAKVGENYPPMHPWCRSVTIANIEDDELKSLDRRAGREKVPADMTYKEWEDKFVVDVDELQEDEASDTISLQEQISNASDKIIDLKKQFLDTTEAETYDEWFKEYDSIEAGYGEVPDDEMEIFEKLKELDKEIKETTKKKIELLLQKERRKQLDTGYDGAIPDDAIDIFNAKALEQIKLDTGYSDEKAIEFQKALQEYFGGDYGTILSGETQTAKIIKNGIERMPIYDGSISRGMIFNNVDVKKFTNLQPGDTLSQRGMFESWSNDGRTALGFSGIRSYDRSSVILECANNKTAVGVQHLSSFGELEAEVLSCAKYEVVEVSTQSKYDYLSEHKELLYFPEDLMEQKTFMEENVVCVIKVKEV